MPSKARLVFYGAAASALLALSWNAPAAASDIVLAPQTKLRVTVVQWMPMKGAFEQWNALGGEFTINGDGMLVMPVIGAVPVGTLDSKALAAEISTRLQTSLGTVDKPDTTVEVVAFPPIYLLGDVTNPGEYGYRAGLNVLQAVALGGGETRAGQEQSRDQIRLVGELTGLDNEILRATARTARLRAEMDGTAQIEFPSEPADAAGRVLAREVVAQEQAIFDARVNELDRQTKSLNELRELLNAEIGVLESKIKAADENIAALESELKNVSVLVDKGIAIASRRSELERVLASYRSDRLDQVTAVMRARQGVAETTRNLDSLHDRRRTEIASDLQKEQSGLEQMVLRRDVSRKLLMDLLASATGAGVATPSFTIVRQDGGKSDEIAADAATPLRPGDVVRVTLERSSTAPSFPLSAQAGERATQ